MRHLGTFGTASEAAAAYDSAMWHLRYRETNRRPALNNPQYCADNPPPLLPEVLELRTKIDAERLGAGSNPLAGTVALMRDKVAIASGVGTSLAILAAQRFALTALRADVDKALHLLAGHTVRLAEYVPADDVVLRTRIASEAGVPTDQLPQPRGLDAS